MVYSFGSVGRAVYDKSYIMVSNLSKIHAG